MYPKLQGKRDFFALLFEDTYLKIKLSKKHQTSNFRPKFTLLPQFSRIWFHQILLLLQSTFIQGNPIND